MTLLNNNSNLLTFHVNDHKQASSWYYDQVGKAPVHIDEEKAVFDIDDSLLVLVKKPHSSKYLQSTPSFSLEQEHCL